MIALGAFAAFCSPELFFPFFFAGVVLGVAVSWNATAAELQNQSSAVCAQGFLEMATGIKFPPIVNLLTNVALTAAHIDHLIVYPPIIGLYVGGQVGRLATPHIKTFYTDHLEPVVQLCSKKITNLSCNRSYCF
jgi:hypothetical protein